MPVVILTAADHPQREVLLPEIADAIAGTLGLGPGDVIVHAVTAVATAISGGGVAAGWPLVSIHGSHRGAGATAAARDAAQRAVQRWSDRHGVAIGGVWTEWVVPAP